MEQAIEDFICHLRDRNRSPVTVQRYGELLRRALAVAQAELHVERVALGQFDRALALVFVREGGRPGAVASAGTRNARLAALRSFFRWAVAEGRLIRDPSDGVVFAARPERAPTFLTEDEFATLRRAVETSASDYYLRRDLALLVTFWHTGMRLSELLSVDLQQMDFEGECFHQVRRKGGRLAEVFFNAEVTIALRRWLWVRREYPRSSGTQALFLSDRGNRLSARAVEEMVAKYARAARIAKRVTPHVFRHSTATALVRAGNGIEVVAEVLAHRSLNVTRQYVHLVGEQVRTAVASLAGGRVRRAAAR